MLAVENERVIQLLAAESFLHRDNRLLLGPILPQLELPIEEGSLIPAGVVDSADDPDQVLDRSRERLQLLAEMVRAGEVAGSQAQDRRSVGSIEILHQILELILERFEGVKVLGQRAIVHVDPPLGWPPRLLSRRSGGLIYLGTGGLSRRELPPPPSIEHGTRNGVAVA